MSEAPTGATAGQEAAAQEAAAQRLAEGESVGPETPELRPSLEAVLMVADQPLDHLTLATAVGHPAVDVLAALESLAAEYTEQGRGFELRNVAGGWRYYTREEHAGVVEAFVLEGQQSRLTQAALETLAVVAYKQPVSRARVSAIRGVNVDGVMRTLLTRGLVEEAGADQETGAHLYRTTNYFLERIGITSLDDLPELAPFLPDIDDLDDDLAAFAGGAPAAAPNAGEDRAEGPAEPSADDVRGSSAAPVERSADDVRGGSSAAPVERSADDVRGGTPVVSDGGDARAATVARETSDDVPEERE